MKREKRLTKREQKALKAPPPGAQTHTHQHEEEHIHCLACGRHLGAAEFEGRTPTATRLSCRHGGRFPSCAACAARTKELLAIHDLTGQPPQAAAAWH